MGFTLILLAGLQAIPPDLYEAAEMDGTKRERIFWRITLPLLWPNLLVVIVLALIKGVQTFDEVFVLTGWSRHSYSIHCSVHLQHRLYESDSKLWLGCSCLRHFGSSSVWAHHVAVGIQ